jgi:N utilization substance protein B
VTRRRRARIVALEVLYALEHGGGNWREALAAMASRSKLDEEGERFAERLLEATLRNKHDLDRLLASASRRWEVARMPVVDRNIMRVGAAQLMYMPDIPPKVAIDEAVELAKIYGGPESPAFVNGVLDNVAHVAHPRPSGSGGEARTSKRENRHET